MPALIQHQSVHIYHYHYLYSKDANYPRTITETKMNQNPHTGLTQFHHHVYTILLIKEETSSTPTQGNIQNIPKVFKKEQTTKTTIYEPKEYINSSKSQIVPTQDYFGEHQALDGLLKLGRESKIECKIMKPHAFHKIKLSPIQIPTLLNSQELITRRATLQAKRVSRQARLHAKNISLQLSEIIERDTPTESLLKYNRSSLNSPFGKGVRVYKGSQEGVVLSSYKRKGRQIRWRVEWDTGERELCYRKDLQVV